MAQKRNSRSVQATPEGVVLLQKAKAMGRSEEGKPLTYEGIGAKAGLDGKTVSRFFQRDPVDRDSAHAIVEALNLQGEKILFRDDILVAESIDKIRSDNEGGSERANQLIGGLEEALRGFQQDREVSLEAMEWLKAQRKTLARDAAGAVLNKHNIGSSEAENLNALDVEQFAQDLRQYLQLLYLSLDIGTWELIDEALKEPSIPINREIRLYTEALIFIKEQRVEQQLSSDVSQVISLYLDYLIKIMPIRF